MGSRRLLDLVCGSWLVYATRAEDQHAIRVRDIVLFIKRGEVEPDAGRLYAELVVERMAAELGPPLNELFSRAVLIPVPGAGLTSATTVWPALSICYALVASGLGTAVAPLLRRAHAVHKSAGSQIRPSVDEHYASFAVERTLDRLTHILLVDDVVTSGTTLMAAAHRLHEAFPTAIVAAFALARVHSTGGAPHLVEPAIERLVLAGQRCRREPLDRMIR